MSTWWVALVTVAVYVAALSVIARWLVGVPVGPVRTALTGTVGFFVIVPLTALAVGASGLVDEARLARGDVHAGYLLVFAVSALWVCALGATFLAGLEYLWPTRRSVGTLARLRGCRDRGRRMLRYVEIMRIALRHGLWPLFRGASIHVEEAGPALVTALSEAGVAFVKLGQVLATRRDIVPAQLADELASLHAAVVPEEWTTVKNVLEAELGRPLHTVFAHIEAAPLAAASIGQVHAATLIDGERVVVKVQRPQARTQVEVDIDIALRLSRRLERRSESARRVGAERLTTELASSLRNELDYRNEERNLVLMRSSVSRCDGGIRVPRSYTELTTGRALIMERMPGRPLATAASALRDLSLAHRRDLCVRLIDGVLHQIFVEGVFHADLHPGNIMLADDGTLGLIDFGAVAIIDREQRELLSLFLSAFHAEDTYSAVVAIRRLTDGGPLPDERELRRDLGELFTIGAIERDTAVMSERLLRLFHRHGLAVPGSLAAAVRTMASLQEAVSTLDDTLEYADILLDRMHRVTRQGQDPRRAARMVATQALTISQIVRRIPSAVDALTEAHALSAGRTAARIRDHRIWVSRRLQSVSGCALAALLGAAAFVLMLHGGGPLVTPGIPLLPLSGAALGATALVVGVRSFIGLMRLAPDSSERHES